MEVHKYKVTVFDEKKKEWRMQRRIYIPNEAVLGYIDGHVDFFSTDSNHFATAQKIVDTQIEDEEGIYYRGKINLPDRLVLQAIQSGKELENARNVLQDLNLLIKEVDPNF